MNEIVTKYRFVLQAGFDCGAWLLGLWLATLLRYELQFDQVNFLGLIGLGSIAMVAQLVLGRLGGLYVHRWRYGTFDEILGTLRVVSCVTVLVAAADAFSPGLRPIPVSASVMSGFIALGIMCAGRLVWRQRLEKWTRAEGDDRMPIIVVGAGSGGLQVVTAMVKAGPFHPVAVIDDNPDLRNLRIKGVKVCGDRSSLARVVEQTGARHIILAMPSASGEFIRDIAKRADELELQTLILPPVDEMFGVGVNVADIRPLTEADLLGRRELSLDIESVAGYLTGKRVLVTGAGGSIGSELCRQIHRFAPESLVMLDRDESALQAVQISIEGRGLLDSRDLVVCCIRDSGRLRQVFEEHRPEVVFHAAALKHLPLLEMYAEEGWKTNVWGTQNLLELAGEFEVGRFVNISTDKAADASSVLGQTKRIAEQLTSHAGEINSGTYLSVRFGNVLGSRGSVLPLFREQIAQGGPITVTHPEVTRFFMTIPEACELVIQAGALSHDGEVLVLDMGEPVKIADLARRLIAECDRSVEIVYTGLRPGEKMHEVLFSPDELPTASEHPMVQRVEVPSMTPALAAFNDPYLEDPVIDLRASSTSSAPRLPAQS
ncbi:MAG: nucleoside-diphosphate sugar epimerase/dehydratase [Microthrixaceae bacterium]